jgi:hypothetical protein
MIIFKLQLDRPMCQGGVCYRLHVPGTPCVDLLLRLDFLLDVADSVVA